MFGINLREIALITLAVVFLFGFVVGSFYLPQPYKDALLLVGYVGTLVVAGFLIVRWFIRRRQN